MARGDPDPQCRRADGELQWGNEFDCLAIDAGMHGRWGLDLEVRSAPGSPRRVLPLLWCVEHQDSQLTAGERRSSAETGTVQRIRIVGDQQHSKPCMLSSGVVDEAQRRHSPTGTKHPARRLRQGADLRVAIAGLPDCLSVDAEGDVVQEDAAVHFAHVDQALHPIRERVKSPGHVLPVHTEVQREVVARPDRDADEGQPMRRGDCCYVRERPVAARHPERICTIGHDLQDACPQVVAGAEDHCFDSALACLLDDPVAGRRAVTRPGVDEQHRPSRRLDRAPATSEQRREPRRRMPWMVHVAAFPQAAAWSFSVATVDGSG